MRLTSIDQFKRLKGHSVLGIPTGNRAKRGVDRQEPVEFFIEKVGHKYITFTRPYNYREEKMTVNGATEQAVRSGYGSNAGYLFFDDLEAVNAYYERERKEQLVIKFFRGVHSLNKMPDSILDAIVQQIKNYEGVIDE